MSAEEGRERELKKISLKYEGRCIGCGRKIPAGEVAYWEKDKGVWHVECERIDARHARSGTRRSPWFKPSVWFFASIVMVALLTGVYANRLEPQQLIQTSISTAVREKTFFTISVTTETCTTTSVSTVLGAYSTQKMVSTMSEGCHIACPYGGTYYSSICTRLCGCQYDVCVSFDYNCANDYRAMWTCHTYGVTSTSVMQRPVTTQTNVAESEQILTFQSTGTSTFAEEIVSTQTLLVQNPMTPKLRLIVVALWMTGGIGLVGAWLFRKR